jgi:hypothetical protein
MVMVSNILYFVDFGKFFNKVHLDDNTRFKSLRDAFTIENQSIVQDQRKIITIFYLRQFG